MANSPWVVIECHVRQRGGGSGLLPNEQPGVCCDSAEHQVADQEDCEQGEADPQCDRNQSVAVFPYDRRPPGFPVPPRV